MQHRTARARASVALVFAGIDASPDEVPTDRRRKTGTLLVAAIVMLSTATTLVLSASTAKAYLPNLSEARQAALVNLKGLHPDYFPSQIAPRIKSCSRVHQAVTCTGLIRSSNPDRGWSECVEHVTYHVARSRSAVPWVRKHSCKNFAVTNGVLTQERANGYAATYAEAFREHLQTEITHYYASLAAAYPEDQNKPVSTVGSLAMKPCVIGNHASEFDVWVTATCEFALPVTEPTSEFGRSPIVECGGGVLLTLEYHAGGFVAEPDPFAVEGKGGLKLPRGWALVGSPMTGFPDEEGLGCRWRQSGASHFATYYLVSPSFP